MKLKFPILIAFFSSLLLVALVALLPVQFSMAQNNNDACLVVLSQWRSGPEIPNKHLEAGTAVVHDKLYVFSGFDTNSLTTSKVVDVYNPTSGIWETIANPRQEMPFAASHIQAAVDGQYVWFAGGFTGKHPGPTTDAVWRYDTVSDTWTQGPKLPEKRAGGFLVRVGRSLHFGGGLINDRDTSMPDHWALNLDNVNAGWKSLPGLPNPRNHLSGISIKGRLYAIGGQYFHDRDPVDLKLMHIYDSATQTWTRGKDLPFNRSHFEPGTTQLGPRAIIVGGRNNQIPGQGRLSEVTVYDSLKEDWYELRELPVDLIAPVAAVLGNQLFVTGGGAHWDVPQTKTYIADISYNCAPPATEVTPDPQTVPLYQPAEGQAVHSAQQVFEWGNVNGTVKYKVKFRGVSTEYRAKQVFRPQNFPCSGGKCSTIISLNPPLPNKEQLRWQVVAVTSVGKNKSDWQNFFTQIPGKAALSAPSNNSTIDQSSPMLAWSAVPLASRYKLVVKDFENNKLLKQDLDSSACQGGICSLNTRDFGLQLTIGQNYRWLVKAINDEGKVKSDVWQFKVGS